MFTATTRRPRGYGVGSVPEATPLPLKFPEAFFQSVFEALLIALGMSALFIFVIDFLGGVVPLVSLGIQVGLFVVLHAAARTYRAMRGDSSLNDRAAQAHARNGFFIGIGAMVAVTCLWRVYLGHFPTPELVVLAMGGALMCLAGAVGYWRTDQAGTVSRPRLDR